MTTGRYDWERARERMERARLAMAEERSPEEERTLLAERARVLAAPLAESLEDGDTRDVVIFALGGERFAVDALHVMEALDLGRPTPVPGTPDSLLGVVNHRGRVLPVMDLRPQLVPGGAAGDELAHIIAVSVDGMRFGIAAETVQESSRWQTGELDSGLLTLLDLEALAADPRLRIEDD